MSPNLEKDLPAGLVSSARDGVAHLTLDRPQHRNALSTDILAGLASELARLDADPDIRAIVLAGSPDIFASGADLRDLQALDAVDVYFGERLQFWSAIRGIRTPRVAAVSGLCLGGGCELALTCDIVVASITARFGFPETKLGLIPGAGGTQLLARAIGRPKALEVVLAGRLLTATEAEATGLVSRVVPADEWLSEAERIASEIAARSRTAVALAREAVNASFETSLMAGLELERKAFAIAFASDDAREGIAAFLEKRTPVWSHER